MGKIKNVPKGKRRYRSFKKKPYSFHSAFLMWRQAHDKGLSLKRQKKIKSFRVRGPDTYGHYNLFVLITKKRKQ